MKGINLYGQAEYKAPSSNNDASPMALLLALIA